MAFGNHLENLSPFELREKLDYFPETGKFIWKASSKFAGSLDKEDGYLRISFNNRKYLGHRLAWLHYYGEWPNSILDHRDGVRSNNSINNLRVTTQSKNLENQTKPRSNNVTGYLGVSPAKCGGYRARIVVDGKQRHLGVFITPQQASEVYLAAKKEFHE